MAAKLDLKREYKHLYSAPTTEPVMVDVPSLSYLMIDGQGNPNTAPAYAAAVEALYAVAYRLKFMSKNGEPAQDFTVMPLQGLWWSEDMAAFSPDAKDDWLWTMMILQPAHIDAGMVAQALDDVRAKKNPPALDGVRFETYDEGRAAQIMHIGPYAAEAPTIAALHAWIATQGCTHQGAGHHHEIYLGDPRRVAPEKLKTIIRQPVITAAER